MCREFQCTTSDAPLKKTAWPGIIVDINQKDVIKIFGAALQLESLCVRIPPSITDENLFKTHVVGTSYNSNQLCERRKNETKKVLPQWKVRNSTNRFHTKLFTWKNYHMHGCETHYRGTQKIVQSSFLETCICSCSMCI